jgi:hypothetical protein
MQFSTLYLDFQSRRIIGTEVEGFTLLATIRAPNNSKQSLR